MRHATPAALDQLEAVLARLRAVPGLREKSRGVFYRGSQAFLHFHEDPAGLFADVRSTAEGFERLNVTSPEQQEELLDVVREALA